MTQVQSGFENTQPDLDDELFAGIEEDGKPTAAATVYDDLMAAVQAPVELPPLALKVLSRPGVTILFNVNIDQPLVQLWRKRAKDTKDPDGMNSLQFASTVIANQAIQVYMQGKAVEGRDHKPLNFRHPEWLSMLGTPSAKEAIKTLYGADTHILAVCSRIMEEAGYAGEDVDADEDSPTAPSSIN